MLHPWVLFCKITVVGGGGKSLFWVHDTLSRVTAIFLLPCVCMYEEVKRMIILHSFTILPSCKSVSTTLFLVTKKFNTILAEFKIQSE